MIKINSKYPCHNRQSSTNKVEKPLTLTIDANRVAYSDKDMGIVVLKPIIDRICFGFFPTQEFVNEHDPSIDIEEYTDSIKKALFGDAKAKDMNLSLAKNVNFMKSPWVNYNVNLHFQPPGCSEPALIQISPKKPGWAYIKIDMNPSKMTPAGMTAFRGWIENTLMMPTAKVTYEKFLIWSRITRVDVAVEILGQRPNDLTIKPVKAGKPIRHPGSLYYSDTSRIETIYPKVSPGKKSTEYVYDKRENELKKGKVPEFGEFLHTRVECRIGKTKFFKLAGLKNRCARLQISGLHYQKFYKKKYNYQVFIRLAIALSLTRALKLIPDKFKNEHTKAFSETNVNIWKPGELWKLWPKALANSGLMPDGYKP